MMADVLRYAEEHRQEALDLLIELAQIPSPSGREDRRAKFCKQWLSEQGAQGVYIDGACNVIYPVGDVSTFPVYVVAAHSDIVFAEEQPLVLKRDGERLYCPGIGDDTANVAALMMAAKYVAENRLSPKTGGVLFVIDSCEEGLGNLKGIRAIADRFADRMAECISFDCYAQDLICNAVGSKRYRLEVETQGGHSYFDFGRKNAIAEAALLITALYQMPIPDRGRTTYNVGEISGGTSVNTIAQHAEMMFECRSDDRVGLHEMDLRFKEVIDRFRESGLDISVTLIGERPCGADVNTDRQKALVERSEKTIQRCFGWKPLRKSGSTDCNMPLSLGIPSVSFGCITGSGMHTREEYIDIDSIAVGMRLALETVLFYF